MLDVGLDATNIMVWIYKQVRTAPIMVVANLKEAGDEILAFYRLHFPARAVEMPQDDESHRAGERRIQAPGQDAVLVAASVG